MSVLSSPFLECSVPFFLFSSTLVHFTPASGLVRFVDLCIDDHGSFVIFRSASVRPNHLSDHYSTMITSSNSLCREWDAQSFSRRSTSHHGRFRAFPRTNRTQTKANTHIHFATSSTNELPSCGPSRLWQCSCAGASPDAGTGVASVG